MCDYSLHGVKNRLAVEGEQLVVHKFHTGSKGLAPWSDVEAVKPADLITLIYFKVFPEKHWDLKKQIPAVCIPHGARLLMEGIPRHAQKLFGIGETEEVTLIQLTGEAGTYRDAVRFDHRLLLPLDPSRACDVLSLQNLPEGICAEVLSLELEEEAGAMIQVNQTQRSIRANG